MYLKLWFGIIIMRFVLLVVLNLFACVENNTVFQPKNSCEQQGKSLLQSIMKSHQLGDVQKVDKFEMQNDSGVSRFLCNLRQKSICHFFRKCRHECNNRLHSLITFFSTVSFTDLDQGSEKIIFESILTTFIESVIVNGRWGISKNWLNQ